MDLFSVEYDEYLNMRFFCKLEKLDLSLVEYDEYNEYLNMRLFSLTI